jgi:hypothetical protein
MMRHLDGEAVVFATLDMVAGYHQVPVHEDDRHLLTVISQYGRHQYNCLSQGITSASDFFNLLTDGGVRYEGFDKIHKNMDDILFAARSIQELEEMLSKFLNFCQVKNIKLKGSKLCVSECVEFGGVRICREELGRKDSVFIQPKKQRIHAFEALGRPTTKREAQVWCGMIASLSAWFPAVNLSCPLLRKATQGSEKLRWTPDLEAEYLATKKIMKKEIRLSPYNEKKWLNLVIDGASSRGIGFVCYQLVDEEDPSKGANIVQAGASLLPSNLGFSPVD